MIRFRITYQFQHFVRKRDRPRLIDALGELGKDKPKWNTTKVHEMVAQGPVNIDLIPEIDDSVSPHIRYLDLVWVLDASALEPDRRWQAPVGSEVFVDLPVDSPNSRLELLVSNLPV
jgi:hypothetical protein